MKTTKYKVGRYIKRCWREISFKDKGLILIMIVLLLQCIHNLYSPAPTSQSYMTINLIIRTSVAAIFGYFLSSNFLSKLAIDKSIDDKLRILEQILEDNEIDNELKNKYSKKLKKEQLEEEQEQEGYVCNKNLQNGIAVGICILIIICLIIGINFKLISDGADAIITQFRDIISGCIGFLLGNNGNNDKVK